MRHELRLDDVGNALCWRKFAVHVILQRVYDVQLDSQRLVIHVFGLDLRRWPLVSILGWLIDLQLLVASLGDVGLSLELRPKRGPICPVAVFTLLMAAIGAVLLVNAG